MMHGARRTGETVYMQLPDAGNADHVPDSEADREAGGPGAALEGEPEVVVRQDLLRQGQAEALAVGLGGEERREQALLDVLGDRRAGVLDDEDAATAGGGRDIDATG